MIQQTTSWPIRSYTKFALALAYFPESNSATAARRLNRWIRRNSALSDALTATGYNISQHSFTSRQTGLIFEYLGEP